MENALLKALLKQVLGGTENNISLNRQKQNDLVTMKQIIDPGAP